MVNYTIAALALCSSRECNTMKSNTALILALLVLACIASMMLFPAHSKPVQANVTLDTSYSNPSGSQANVTHSSGSYNVIGKPTIMPAYINHVLCSAQSPACGTGEQLYNDGVQAGIDPAYALAFFRHESSYGRYGIAHDNLGLGNIRCTSGYTCLNGFRAYASWDAGYKDWYALIVYYANVLGKRTIPDIVRTYAPDTENNTEGYIIAVEQDVDAMRGSK